MGAFCILIKVRSFRRGESVNGPVAAPLCNLAIVSGFGGRAVGFGLQGSELQIAKPGDLAVTPFDVAGNGFKLAVSLLEFDTLDGRLKLAFAWPDFVNTFKQHWFGFGFPAVVIVLLRAVVIRRHYAPIRLERFPCWPG